MSAQAEQVPKDIARYIRQADDGFEQAFSRGDAAAVSRFYTSDGALLPAGSDFVRGRRAIAAYWKGVMDMGVAHVKLHILELEQHADCIVEMGQYRLMAADDSAVDHGKYILLWRQEDGEWKVHRDIWTTSVPPEA